MNICKCTSRLTHSIISFVLSICFGQNIAAVNTVVEGQASAAVLFNRLKKTGAGKGSGDASFIRDALIQAEKKLSSQELESLKLYSFAVGHLSAQYVKEGADHGNTYWGAIQQCTGGDSKKKLSNVLLLAKEISEDVGGISRRLEIFWSPGALLAVAAHKAKKAKKEEQQNAREREVTG